MATALPISPLGFVMMTLLSSSMEELSPDSSHLHHVTELSLLTLAREPHIAVCDSLLIMRQYVDFLEFPHNGNGSQTKLIHRDCPTLWTIYVPDDPKIQKACIVPNHENPHNHPILPPTKMPAMVKEIYKMCVKNAGIVGSLVRTVDNGAFPGPGILTVEAIFTKLLYLARSTKLTLGTAPSLYTPTLHNNHVKQDIIQKVKKESYPYGMDVPGTC